jgi:hypothetical protein
MKQATQQERIRVIFRRRADSYDLAEVACLTGMPLRTLRREVAGGYRDAVKVGGSWRFTWRQAVCLALECRTLAEIHEALGPDAAKVLSPLLELRSVTVRLPKYIILALEAVAAENGTTMENALHGELLDFAGTVSPRLSRRIAGYKRAYLYPGHAR